MCSSMCSCVGDELACSRWRGEAAATAAADAVAVEHAPSPARFPCTPASATAPTTGARPGTGARRDGRPRPPSSAATAVRRSAGTARSRSPPAPGRIGWCVHRSVMLDHRSSRRASRPPCGDFDARVTSGRRSAGAAAGAVVAVLEHQAAAVAFGDLPAEDQADAGAAGLGREERHEQVAGVRQARALRPRPTAPSSAATSRADAASRRGRAPPVSRTASTALRIRLIRSCSS